MPKPNPLPLEGCTDEESIKYLSTHIENLNEKIEELEKAFVENEAAKQQRAWAFDVTSRFFDKSVEPDFAKVVAFAKSAIEYLEGGKQ